MSSSDDMPFATGDDDGQENSTSQVHCRSCQRVVDISQHNGQTPNFCPHCGGSLLAIPSRDSLVGVSRDPTSTRVVLQREATTEQGEDNEAKLAAGGVDSDGVEVPWETPSASPFTSQNQPADAPEESPADDEQPTEVGVEAVPPAVVDGLLPASNPSTVELAEDDIIAMPPTPPPRSAVSLPAQEAPVVPVTSSRSISLEAIDARLAEEAAASVVPAMLQQTEGLSHAGILQAPSPDALFQHKESAARPSSGDDVASLRYQMAQLSEQFDQKFQVLLDTTVQTQSRIDSLWRSLEELRAVQPASFGVRGSGFDEPSFSAQGQGSKIAIGSVFLVIWTLLCLFIFAPIFAGKKGTRLTRKGLVSQPGSQAAPRRIVAPSASLPPLPARRVGAIPPLPERSEPAIAKRTPTPAPIPTPRPVRRRLAIAPRPVARRLNQVRRPSRPPVRRRLRVVAKPNPPQRRIEIVVAPKPRPRPSFSLPNIKKSLPLSKRCDICARKLYAATFRKLTRNQRLSFFRLCNQRCNRNWNLFKKRFVHWCTFRNLGDSTKCPAALKRNATYYQYQTWLRP